MSAPLQILVAIGATLNAYATGVLLRSPFYDAKQKWLQVGVVWLLPVIGAILVWSLARNAKSRPLSSASDIGSGFDDGDIRLDNYSSGEGGDGESGGDGGGGGD